MAMGDSPFDRELNTAWCNFCDRLKTAGERVFKDVNPATELQRVDGFRYLTQNLGQAFDLALETRNTRFPALYPFCSPTRKLGSDDADCVYFTTWIDGSSVYKLSGTKGTARMWNVEVCGPRSADAYGPNTRILHEPFGELPEANIFGDELKLNWDGSFELFIGGEKQGANWLPTTPQSRRLFIRQYFDRWDEEASDYRIERVGMDGPRPMPTANEMIDAMQWASDFVYNVVDFWPEWLWPGGYGIDPNALNRFNGKNIQPKAKSQDRIDGDAKDQKRGRLGTQMRWAFDADHALIIEFDGGKDFWKLTSEGIFGNSMDFLYRPVSYTPSRAAVDPDGKTRLIMTARDPGYANWVDNQGYTSGVVSFRNVMATSIPELRTRLVPVVNLAEELPHSKRMTPHERVQELHRRFNAIRRRYRL
jgi:uncharacterized protein DUF1214